MSNDQSHWTDEDRSTNPGICHLCGMEHVPLRNFSRHYGGYQGPHWLCGLCSNTQAGSMKGAGNWVNHGDAVQVVADVAALLHAAGLTPDVPRHESGRWDTSHYDGME